MPENNVLVEDNAADLLIFSEETIKSQQQELKESQIWIDFQEGSDEALAKLYETYAHKLFNYGRQITTDKELVNDAIQDVFLYLINRRKELGAAVSVKFYLFASFRRSLMRALKNKRKLALTDDYDRQDGFQIQVDPDIISINTCMIDDIDINQLVEKTTQDLPVRQREIIMLHFFEGLSYKQIAEVMGFSQVRSARNLLYRAVHSLSQVLDKYKDEIFSLIVFYLITTI